MDDPRKYKRVSANFSCSLRREDNGEPVSAIAMNVSSGGMAVVASKELPTGALVEIRHREFPCAAAGPNTSKCRIVFVRPAKGSVGGFYTGMAFETTDKAFIQDLLQWAQLQAHVQKRSQPRAGAQRPTWGRPG